MARTSSLSFSPFSVVAGVRPSYIQQAKLQATDIQAGDKFGISVGISGDTMIVGSWLESPGGISAAGSAYIFTRSGTTWTQQAKLSAFDGQTNDFFGLSAAISGDTVVVGAFRHSPGGIQFAGAAYVFVRSGTTWTLQAKLLASDRQAGDNFGGAVAISGNTVVVGASFENEGGPSAGAAYIFTRSGTTWTQQAKRFVFGNNIGFGRGVGVSASTVVVGAYQYLTGGAVMVYLGPSWTQQTILQASDAQVADLFGDAVAISGDTVVVGSLNEDTGGDNAGAAYVFVRSGTTWTQQAKIQASDAQASDQFGVSVAIDGDTVIIGSRDSTSGSQAGAAYIFTRSGTTWTQQAKIQASDIEAGDSFGAQRQSLGVSGAYFVVGAYEEDTGGSDAGAAYVFVK